jgi:hypothetical protein
VNDALIHPDDLMAMKTEPGDLIYVQDKRWWLGGLKSLHTRAASPAMEAEVQNLKAEKGVIFLSAKNIALGMLNAAEPVKVEKIM